jgi:hypothetical protein
MAGKGGYRPGAGRPKAAHTIQAEAAKKVLVQMFVAQKAPIFQAMINQAKNGNVQAFKELTERVWGKEAQPLSGELNLTHDVPNEIYKGIVRREVQRADIEDRGEE